MRKRQVLVVSVAALWACAAGSHGTSGVDPATNAGGDAGAVAGDRGDGGTPDGTSEAGAGRGQEAGARSAPRDYDACPGSPPGLSVPITINDSANASVARDPALTSFLVPFARGAQLFSLDGLLVRDASGARLPAQFETLGRWGGHRDDCASPIRYAYAHVHAVPPPGTQVTWTVANDPSAGPEESPLSITVRPTSWILDTGTARFTVRRDTFEGLSKVELTSEDPPIVVSDLSAAAGTGGFFVEHAASHTEAATLAPWRLDLERQGPQTATVVARGFYAAQGGARDLGYTVRLHFAAGSSVVRVEHTYYYGAVASAAASGASNTTTVDRAYLAIPLASAPTAALARAVTTVQAVDPASPLQLEQIKRTQSAIAARYAVTSGGRSLETGASASANFLSVRTADATVTATIARLEEREPQGLRYDPATRSLALDFTSSPMQIGGARGIWSVAAVDFGGAKVDPATRAAALQLAAERPLLGAPQPGYVNGTETLGPYAVDDSDPRYASFFSLIERFHVTTRSYLRDHAITGLQIWPDLPRFACVNVNDSPPCSVVDQQKFDGGDDNYWNWSKVGLDEFLRTGRNELAWDFSIPEATTMAETIALRPDHDRLADSAEAGLAACYGDSTNYGATPMVEGLNQRTGDCPGDYTYDKTAKLAYLVTGDQRFVDYFEEAGQSAAAAFGDPPRAQAGAYDELALFRLSEQRLELLADGAEFAGDEAVGTKLIATLRAYVDEMLGHTLLPSGDACNTNGTGYDSAIDLGVCQGNQAWMMPVAVEWMIRASRFLGHAGLAAFVPRYAATAGARYTVLGDGGLPDYSQRDQGAATDPTDASLGWRTVYQCSQIAGGTVVESSCGRSASEENNGYFYVDGVIAFLNVFGLALAADPTGAARVCQWLPSAYQAALTTGLAGDTSLLNGYVWGKAPGQMFGMAEETIGALTMLCP